MGNGLKSEVVTTVKHIARVFLRRGRKTRSVKSDARSHGRYTDAELITELKKLRLLIAPPGEQVVRVVCNELPESTEKEYIHGLYHKLDNLETLRLITKSDEMTLCRLVNLHLMLTVADEEE